MRDTPPAAAPDEGVTPFQVDCPTCGRDSDAPKATFLAGPVAPVPNTTFLLCRINCEGCGTGFDRVLWPMDEVGLPPQERSSTLGPIHPDPGVRTTSRRWILD